MIHGESLTTAWRLWVEGRPAEDISDAVGYSVATLYHTAQRCGFPRRRRVRSGGLEMCPGDPTPEQIAERAAAIRARNMEAKRGHA